MFMLLPLGFLVVEASIVASHSPKRQPPTRSLGISNAPAGFSGETFVAPWTLKK
jgi:hypothetical protein